MSQSIHSDTAAEADISIRWQLLLLFPSTVAAAAAAALFVTDGPFCCQHPHSNKCANADQSREALAPNCQWR